MLCSTVSAQYSITDYSSLTGGRPGAFQRFAMPPRIAAGVAGTVVSYLTREKKDQMTTISRRRSIVSVFAVVFARESGMLRAQGLTDYKPGEGGGPITGSASSGEAASAAPTLERWPVFLCTLARRLLLP